MSKESLLPMMAQHVLKHGMTGLSLRPLARAAGTSDRMLIYHFGNKEKLIAQLLAYIADSYANALDARFEDKLPGTRQELLRKLLADTQAAEMAPFLALWWEIVAGSARDVTGYLDASQAVMDQLLSWLETRMPEGDPDPSGGARYLLTLIEGAQMLSAVGRGSIAREGIEAAGL